MRNKTNIEKKEIAYGVRLRRVNKKNDYITNLINGRYYLARYNIMVKQIIAKDIVETIDGAPKTLEFMVAEAALIRMQAIKSLRTAHFSKLELKKDFGLTDDAITRIDKEYYVGNIVRDNYDEDYIPKTKAEFVNPSED